VEQVAADRAVKLEPMVQPILVAAVEHKITAEQLQAVEDRVL
jgi:hypothetical protein